MGPTALNTQSNMSTPQTTTPAETEANQGPHAEDEPTRSELAQKLSGISARLDAQSTLVHKHEAELEAKEEHIQELEREIEGLNEEIDRLDARTDLLQLIGENNEMDAEQRSTILIQHLKRAAERQHEQEGVARSSVNRDEAEAALQYPSVDRSTIYTDMRRAERLVDNKNVCWYKSGSGGESRLHLSLEAGELPGKLASTTRGEEA